MTACSPVHTSHNPRIYSALRHLSNESSTQAVRQTSNSSSKLYNALLTHLIRETFAAVLLTTRTNVPIIVPISFHSSLYTTNQQIAPDVELPLQKQDSQHIKQAASFSALSPYCKAEDSLDTSALYKSSTSHSDASPSQVTVYKSVS